MICSNCSFDNPAGMRFCGQCGTPLTLECGACGFGNPPDFRFCGRCGAPLTGAAIPEPLSPAPQPIPVRTVDQAERRQLTVMFCDVVDSTPLSERLDPEELRDVLSIYQQTCAEVIARHGGHIAQYLGDGLLIYFGFPAANDDDAVQGVRAGLEMIEAIGSLDRQLLADRSVQFAIRIGIHTGLVVIGDIGGRERLAMGETTNLAARLQGIAEPNTVVISAATERLAHGFFSCRELGAVSLKGFTHPVEVYRVLHESGARTRLDTARLTPLVGRGRESDLLAELFDAASHGQGQVALIGGDPGIGKSRMLAVLKERVADAPHLLLEGRCSPQGQSSAFHPFVDALEQLFDLHGAPPAERLERLERGLATYSLCRHELGPLFASLLSIPLSESYTVTDATPQSRRRKTLDAVATLLGVISARRTLLVSIEDLHWSDPSSLELVDLLVSRAQTSRMMLVLTCRPELARQWPAHVVRFDLGRLSQEEAAAMVARVAGGRTMPDQVLDQILERTDGVPLFVEELTKMVIESDLLRSRDDRFELIGPLPPLAIPATLHDSLMARLDRLATVKEVAQLGATIGREFPFELLARVSKLAPATLAEALDRLVESELLRRSGVLPNAVYSFKHALIQEAAYESLLRSRRQQYHLLIAQALEEHFPDSISSRPELLAHHYTMAGLERRALLYLQLAGQSATERSAYVEAIDHLTQALAVVESFPDGTERDQQELAIRVALAVPLTATRGIPAPEVVATYERASELCRRIGDTPQLFAVVRGLCTYYWVKGDLERSRSLGSQCIELAERFHSEDQELEAHRILGPTWFWLGDFVQSEHHLSRAVALYDPDKHSAHTIIYGQDPGVLAHAYLGWIEWTLGYPDRARRTSSRSLWLGRTIGHTQSLIPALVFTALLYQSIGDASRTLELAREVIELATEQVLPMWLALGKVLAGWAIAEEGELERGAAMIEEGHTDWCTTGAGLARPYFLGLLVEARARGASIEEQLAQIDEALRRVEENGERFWELELRRLRGALIGRLGSARVPEAESVLREALAIARARQARGFELRIAISLFHLLYAVDRAEEAHALLAEVYDWFTEGHDTPDLMRARKLLEGVVPAEAGV